MRDPLATLKALLLATFACAPGALFGTDTPEGPRPPIIDMHMHGGYRAGRFSLMPDGTPRRRPCGPAPCEGAPPRISSSAEIIPGTLAEMRRHNVVLGVVTDSPPVPKDERWIFDEWRAADPDRFLFGYFIFSGMYAAVGAMCNTDEEAQQAQWPVVMLVIVPAVLIMPILESPNSAMAVSLSLVPFFSPILMWARAATGAAPWWQIAISFVLMAFTVVAVAWVAGRIYKVGILMAGKRPTLPELWRWVKEA